MRLNCYLCTAMPLCRSTAEGEGCVFWDVTAKKRRGIEADRGMMGVCDSPRCSSSNMRGGTRKKKIKYEMQGNTTTLEQKLMFSCINDLDLKIFLRTPTHEISGCPHARLAWVRAHVFTPCRVWLSVYREPEDICWSASLLPYCLIIFSLSPCRVAITGSPLRPCHNTRTHKSKMAKKKQERKKGRKKKCFSEHTHARTHACEHSFIHPSSTAWGASVSGLQPLHSGSSSSSLVLAPWLHYRPGGRGAGWARRQPPAKVLPRDLASLLTSWNGHKVGRT